LGATEKTLPPGFSANYKKAFYRHEKFHLAKQFLSATEIHFLSVAEIPLLSSIKILLL